MVDLDVVKLGLSICRICKKMLAFLTQFVQAANVALTLHIHTDSICLYIYIYIYIHIYYIIYIYICSIIRDNVTYECFRVLDY